MNGNGGPVKATLDSAKQDVKHWVARGEPGAILPALQQVQGQFLELSKAYASSRHVLKLGHAGETKRRRPGHKNAATKKPATPLTQTTVKPNPTTELTPTLEASELRITPPATV